MSEETKVLSGVWRFNDELSSWREYGLEEDEFEQISFNFYQSKLNKTYTANKIEFKSYNGKHDAISFIVSSDSYATYQYSPSDTPGWHVQSMRTIEFTATSTSVSNNFYNWFTANAKQIPTAMKGKWTFNDKLTKPPKGRNSNYTSGYILFTSNSIKY
jgi:hypothetical protein